VASRTNAVFGICSRWRDLWTLWLIEISKAALWLRTDTEALNPRFDRATGRILASHKPCRLRVGYIG